MSILEAGLSRKPGVIQPPRRRGLIVLGKNIETGWTAARIRSTPGHLSDSSRITVRAVREEYKLGTLVVFSGGYTAGPSVPTEADAMWEFFRTLPGEFDERDFRLKDRVSRDTRTNALAVSQIIEGHPSVGFQAITVSYHARRVRIAFANNGVRVGRTIASDTLLLQKDPRGNADVKAYQGSPNFRTERFKEAALITWMKTIDPRGQLLGQVTARTRG